LKSSRPYLLGSSPSSALVQCCLLSWEKNKTEKSVIWSNTCKSQIQNGDLQRSSYLPQVTYLYLLIAQKASFLHYSDLKCANYQGAKEGKEVWGSQRGRWGLVWAVVVREAGNLSGALDMSEWVVKGAEPSFREGAWVKQVLNSRSR
jgi:hypothetical protein